MFKLKTNSWNINENINEYRFGYEYLVGWCLHLLFCCICYVGTCSCYVAICCILILFSYIHVSHVICRVFSRRGSRLLRIWSSLSRYISRICLLIKYKVHISDYIPYFYTFFPSGCLITWWDVYLWYIYFHFFFGSSRAKETMANFSENLRR